MRKILVLMLALVILVSSFAMVGADAFDDSDEKLQSFTYPVSWEDREIFRDNGSSRLNAVSSQYPFEFGVDFDTDVDSKKLVEYDSYNYHDGNMLLEIFEVDGVKYRAFVKCNGAQNFTSQPDLLHKADYELFKFNILNDIRHLEVLE